MRSFVLILAAFLFPCFAFAQPSNSPLPGTLPLQVEQPLDVLMVDGIDRFCLREIQSSREMRESHWQRDYSSDAAYDNSLVPAREKLRTLIGAVDPRIQGGRFEKRIALRSGESPVKTEADSHSSYSVEINRWPTLAGVTAEGLLLIPADPNWKGFVIALPDARWTPEQFTGAAPAGTPPTSRLPQILAENGFLVVIPTLINRDDDFAGNPEIVMTNQSNREWVYRSAFELGRHVIGYEVQKVLAAVDLLTQLNTESNRQLPIGISGVGDGGQLRCLARLSTAVSIQS